MPEYRLNRESGFVTTGSDFPAGANGNKNDGNSAQEKNIPILKNPDVVVCKAPFTAPAFLPKPCRSFKASLWLRYAQRFMTSNTMASGRILLVDDNVDAVQMMQLLLSSLGYTVEIAHTGEDALALARRFLPQVVFSDIGMPGMSGYEVAVELRSDPQLKDVFLLALTGWNDQATRTAVLAAGFDRHLVKPPKIDGIIPVLAEYFSTRLQQIVPINHPRSEDLTVEPTGTVTDFSHE